MEEKKAKCLVATYPILYLSHQYEVGDTLPANNPDMVEAWIAAGTAVWIDDEKQGISQVKAGAQTAETGLAGAVGYAESEDGNHLVGKVPKTPKRSKQ